MPSDKQKRRSIILHIISGGPIASQQQLLEKLRRRGVRTTQATVSRDIRELGLVKVADSANGYRYLPGGAGHGGPAPIAEGVVYSITASSNLLVVRTRPGHAQSVAAGIDSLGWSDILGTVGGDDTVLIILAGAEKAAGIGKRLGQFFALR
ncbi:MAG: hypothetical protein A3F83_16125 [Candidatus Glassbacteria bacterium RIFCSPLOWO2_12_FULL_58_11]|uniref:Arginine repressor n=2 Tax=Candidatus Glassiibacteriota TaxID=1817805 RepID=A0A1F5YTC4_9BACT|nr:MAG: hypothetical protein A2Z86_12450 [Candidatus Glassbacteria bacterium GWA2_58_10]OGG03450.1 MAG: hypothetical protein A3F83_16125 [Candidatus Glassbacteria bacterium RIFCSPLOWO2_12_FULL_58_11]